MAAYSYILSLKDLEHNHSLEGSDPKDFVLSNSFARKFWFSSPKDFETIINNRRVLKCKSERASFSFPIQSLSFITLSFSERWLSRRSNEDEVCNLRALFLLLN